MGNCEEMKMDEEGKRILQEYMTSMGEEEVGNPLQAEGRELRRQTGKGVISMIREMKARKKASERMIRLFKLKIGEKLRSEEEPLEEEQEGVAKNEGKGICEAHKP